MNAYLLRERTQCLQRLEEADWVAPLIATGLAGDIPFSSGNFWAATADYIRTLPDISAFRDSFSQFRLDHSVPRWAHLRHSAEIWLGVGRGRAQQCHPEPAKLQSWQWWMANPEIQDFALRHGS